MPSLMTAASTTMLPPKKRPLDEQTLASTAILHVNSTNSVSLLQKQTGDLQEEPSSISPSHSATATTTTMKASANLPPPPPPASYYDKGSVELAIETPVMMQRLEKRRKLTGSGANDGADCLLIVLVGLPARGKSFIARKLLNCLTWRGNQCKIFNVGKYRRKIAGTEGSEEQNNKSEKEHEPNTQKAQAAVPKSVFPDGKKKACKADFFDDANREAATMRQAAAQLALDEALNWMECGNVQGCHASPENGDSGNSMPTATSFTSLASQISSLADLEEFVADVTSGLESHSARRQYHRIAIFDATNTTNERRQWILQECAKRSESLMDHHSKKHIGVLFLESICDDPELLAENFKVKISSCPDFDGMTQEEALADLKQRIQKYEERYEPLESHLHQSFIKIYNLSSRLMVNHIYGRLAKVVLPAIMAWNTGSRPIYLCRAGETKAMEAYMKLQRQNDNENQNGKAKFQAFRRLKSARLGERGLKFRDKLSEFIEKEGIEFMHRRNDTVIHPSKMDTGTSIAGLYEERDHAFEHSISRSKTSSRATPPWEKEKPPKPAPSSSDDASLSNSSSGSSNIPSFPCLVLSSTMPRAIETATWQQNTFPVKDVSNLNPLDMGDFAGMDLATIQKEYPEWYEQLQREPFFTRFPGGESYSDLIDRLYSIVIDIEQQLGLALIVSHVSVLQVLISYFRSTPIQQCMDIEVPMHTVFKFTPLRGGGWLESHHNLLPEAHEPETGLSIDDPMHITGEATKQPIWGDSRSCLPHKLSIDS